MNKKDYIDAIDEIKADDELKQKTIQKIMSKKSNTYIKVKRILSIAAVFILVFSLSIINKDINNSEIQNITVAKLPTVGSYDNMKKMIEENQEYTQRKFYTDEIIKETQSTIAADNITEVTNNTNYSTTNIQVQGVDEADIVKTNGEYIFYYRREKRTLSIIDVKNEEVVEAIEYEEVIPQEMYLKDNKLIVIADKGKGDFTKSRVYESYNPVIKVIVYDISNIEDIKIDREIEVEGTELTSRMIGNYVYIVSNKGIYSDMLEDENLLKPIYKDSAIGEDEICIDYSNIQYFPGTVTNQYMLVSSFDIANPKKEINVQTYLGSGEKVYASTENLYVVCTQYTEQKEFIGIQYTARENNTKIYKFALDNGNINYIADTMVPGWIESQFSMDEYNGYFRVATTYSSKETLYKDVNNLYVLDENLNLVGQLENLAPGERIYSVRYMGKKAYVVTFEQVDPLFVIDLSNPTNPQVLGQLKIPGYSDYLHPYDENHIIGFGKDTESDGELVKSKGFKMALFDVSDVANPKELYSVNIGDSGTYSELLYNHKALLFSKEKNIIAFPITIMEMQNGSKYYSKTTLRGAMIYGLNIESGFEEKLRISNSNEEEIERIIYINDNIYTLSENLIKVVDMNTMEEVGTIEL